MNGSRPHWARSLYGWLDDWHVLDVEQRDQRDPFVAAPVSTGLIDCLGGDGPRATRLPAGQGPREQTPGGRARRTPPPLHYEKGRGAVAGVLQGINSELPCTRYSCTKCKYPPAANVNLMCERGREALQPPSTITRGFTSELFGRKRVYYLLVSRRRQGVSPKPITIV